MQNSSNRTNTNGNGRLQVSVFASDAGKPADNALIRVTHTADKSVVIDELRTDSSGKTPVIDLAAPPVEFSLNPDSPKPYTEYDINVTLEGYEPVDIIGTQILPDVVAWQNVRLTPLAAPVEQPINYLIEQHTLWGTFPPKIPEAEVKPLPESLGFVVLPNPVVPEFIIVHDGAPEDSSVNNYWVPFKDYIKNVACCEIYSTWPEAAIQANVLAILSFTLNRVYTEWYRGKGFDFTITSSTAYDQAFSYNRNFFDNISSVVDSFFTTFVTRPNIRQPLFTQYCNGSTVTCPNWMEQWGSKQLADQGYFAIDILKNYYGQDIYLMQAKKVEGIPVSYPGTPLQTGSTGPSVRMIQEQLNAISNNYPAINKLRTDGIFGAQTRQAVETFQRIFQLPANGIVDFPTWYQISNIYVAVTKLSG